MSKVDAMQAMREARYAKRPAPTTSAPTTSTPATSKAPVVRTKVDVPDLPVTGEDVPEVEEALCGHRSMNNRMCRRPAGHSEKNHRYN